MDTSIDIIEIRTERIQKEEECSIMLKSNIYHGVMPIIHIYESN